MPDEVFVIVVVAIIAGTFTSVIRMIINYLQERSSQSGSKQGSSLTTSELQRIIEESVEQAVLPLADKMERIERRLDAANHVEKGRLEAPREQELLEEEDVFGMEMDAPAKSQRRRSLS